MEQKRRKNGKNKTVKNIGELNYNDYDSDTLNMIKSLNGTNEKAYIATIVNGKKIKMELDCGSPIILMGKNHFVKYFPNQKLKKYDRQLYSASQNKMEFLGLFTAEMTTNEVTHEMEIVVNNSSMEYLLP